MRRDRETRRARDLELKGVRTQNPTERKVFARLQAEGYEVLKNGWPDCLAVKGDEIRWIEVKPEGIRSLGIRQSKMAQALRRIGIRIEVLNE